MPTSALYNLLSLAGGTLSGLLGFGGYFLFKEPCSAATAPQGLTDLCQSEGQKMLGFGMQPETAAILGAAIGVVVLIYGLYDKANQRSGGFG